MFSFARFADTTGLVFSAALTAVTEPVTRGSLANAREVLRQRSADDDAAERCLYQFLDRAYWG